MKLKGFVFDYLTFSSANSTLFVENKFSVYSTLFIDEVLQNIENLIGNSFNVSQNLDKIIPDFYGVVALLKFLFLFY